MFQDRSIVIATYALCGFANVASIGTVMGALGGMAPAKAADISEMTVRAMITGTVVSFMNACVAGTVLNSLYCIQNRTVTAQHQHDVCAVYLCKTVF